MIRRRNAYRHGIINTESHPTLMRGQVVEIISEEEDLYKVRIFITGKLETIEKKFVLIN